jgi:hypothetical protein
MVEKRKKRRLRRLEKALKYERNSWDHLGKAFAEVREVVRGHSDAIAQLQKRR